MSTLRDDPDLGPAFEDLDEVLDGYDVARVRPRPPRPFWPWPVGAAIAALLLLHFGGWAVLPAPDAGSVVPPSAIEHVPTANVPPMPVVAPSVPALAGEPPRPPAIVVAPREVVEPPAPPLLAVGAVGEPAPDGDQGDAVVVGPDGLEPPTGNLAAEEALYERAREALDRGAWDDAIAGAEAYLREFPEGRYRDKAGLLRLTALVGAARWEDVVATTLALETDPDLTSRRDELRGLRGEALAALGRCDQAWDAVEGLSRTETRRVRQSCP